MSSYNNEQASVKDFVINGAKGLAVGIIAGAVLLFGSAAIAISMSDPNSMTATLGYASLFLSAIIGGVAAARCSRETGIGAAIAGGISGIMLLSLLLVLSFIPAEAADEPLTPLVTVLMYAAVPILSAVAGLIFRRKNSAKRRRRRRR